MKKPQQQSREEFTVDVDGRTYQCERIVSGTRALPQSIRVVGIGTREDTRSYSPREPTMKGAAKLIAMNLIRDEQRAGRS
jgi:hypothetical protein